MNIRIFIIWFLCLICSSAWAQLVEICDNGIDDDNNGLIDLNDDACECENVLPSSLIPNPSFEDRICCPEANAQLECAVGWVQASAPTTDYINTCGDYLGNTNIPAFAPLPLADGQGAVGFRDGEPNGGANWKEYVGACLTETMQAGVEYRLQFFVGFRNDIAGSTSLDIAIFGGTSCSELPFGGNSTTIGCPSNTPTYDRLDIQFVSGSDEWVEVQFDFIPTKDYEVLIVGPSCEINPNFNLRPYFYLDGLTLAEKSDFGLPFDNISGAICNDDLVISIDNEEGQTYQWYKDGVALIGETSNELALIGNPEAEGTYLVVINITDGCISSKEYNVRVPPYYADYTASICQGETFAIDNTTWTESGIYETTIRATDGCDSIITIDLDVIPSTYSNLDEVVCEGDTFRILDIVTTQEGIYTSTILNNAGCDSVVTVTLSEIPASDGIDLPNEVTVLLGDQVDIIPDYYDPILISFFWSDDAQNVLGTDPSLLNQLPLKNTIYSITAEDEYGCDIEETVSIRLDRSSITLYTPNIFSPDGNDINDYFRFESTDALELIEQFIIFDRWGNKVYEILNVNNTSEIKGWDGTFNGQDAAQGVYGWMIRAAFIDGTQNVYSGDVTLIR